MAHSNTGVYTQAHSTRRLLSASNAGIFSQCAASLHAGARQTRSSGNPRLTLQAEHDPRSPFAVKERLGAWLI